MNFNDIEKINFGNKYFDKYYGLSKTIKKFAAAFIASMLLAFYFEGGLRFLFVAISIVSAFFIFSYVKNRTGEPWKEYHYPLMIAWQGGEAAAYVSKINSFEFKAEFFLNMIFKDMLAADMKKLISMSNESHFDALYYFGCLNSEKSIDAPEMIEFKRLSALAQNESPEKYSLMLLLTLIMYKFLGKRQAGIYLMRASHGQIT